MDEKTPIVASPPLAETEAGDIPDIPNRKFVKILGQGGMGAVMMVHHELLDRDEAVKVMKRELSNHPHFADRFRREIKLLSKLDHPNVIRVHDSGNTDQGLFLAMEFVEGQSLDRALPMEPQEIIRIIKEAAEGIAHAHAQGILHRDIKPQNIMVRADGHVKVADFGLARLIDRDEESRMLTQQGAMLGTPDFMAPEQLADASTADERADVYSLGVTLFVCLEGKLPRWPLELSNRNRVHPMLQDVLLRMIHKDPEQRLASMDAVVGRLEQVLSFGSFLSSKREGSIPLPDSIDVPTRPLHLPETEASLATRETIKIQVPEPEGSRWAPALLLVLIVLSLNMFNMYQNRQNEVGEIDTPDRAIVTGIGGLSEDTLPVPHKPAFELELPGLISAVARADQVFAISNDGNPMFVIVDFSKQKPRAKGFPLDDPPLAVAASDSFVYVAVEKDPASLLMIDPFKSHVERRLALPFAPELMVASSDGKVAIAGEKTAIVDSIGGRVHEMDLAGVLDISIINGMAYVLVDGVVHTVNLESPSFDPSRGQPVQELSVVGKTWYPTGYAFRHRRGDCFLTPIEGGFEVTDLSHKSIGKVLIGITNPKILSSGRHLFLYSTEEEKLVWLE